MQDKIRHFLSYRQDKTSPFLSCRQDTKLFPGKNRLQMGQAGTQKRRIGKPLLKCRLVQTHPILTGHPPQPLVRTKSRVAMRHRPPVPRTDLLTCVATEKTVSHFHPYFLRYRLLPLYRVIRHTLVGIHGIRFQRSRRASVHASMTSAATTRRPRFKESPAHNPPPSRRTKALTADESAMFTPNPS